MIYIIFVVTLIIAVLLIGVFVFLNENKKLGWKLVNFIEVNYDNFKIAVNGFTSGIGVISFVYVFLHAVFPNNNDFTRLLLYFISLFFMFFVNVMSIPLERIKMECGWNNAVIIISLIIQIVFAFFLFVY